MLSNCCFAPPLDETFSGGDVALGRCSECKEGAVFKGENNESKIYIRKIK